MVGRRSPTGKPIGLGRHDEVVLVEALDLLGLPGHRNPPPAKADVRMMSFGLGQATDLDYEVHGLLEVLELEAPFDAASVIQKVPTGCLLQVALGFDRRERRDTASTRCAS